MSQPFWLPYQLYTKNIVLVYCIGNSEVLECFRQENITVTWKPYIAESCLIDIREKEHRCLCQNQVCQAKIWQHAVFLHCVVLLSLEHLL